MVKAFCVSLIVANSDLVISWHWRGTLHNSLVYVAAVAMSAPRN